MRIFRGCTLAVALAATTSLLPVHAGAELARAAPDAYAATTTRAIPRAAAVSGSCNLNTADQAQLSLLPGIGPVRARAIIERRQKQPFRTVEEIVKIKGIGRKTFAKLRPYLSVTGPTSIARVTGPRH
jgi:competence protein ComEA